MSSCKLIIYHHFAAEILNTEYTDIYCQEIYTEYLKGTKEFTEGSLHYPLVGFLNYAYLSVKQIVTKVFAELVTPVPRKTIVFRIKLLTFANRKEKASPTAPPDLSREGRSADRKISPKMFRS